MFHVNDVDEGIRLGKYRNLWYKSVPYFSFFEEFYQQFLRVNPALLKNEGFL